MNYLLDVNVLIAWGWSDHVDHQRVAAWIAAIKAANSDVLLTSAIPQLGFVRVSVQRSGGKVTAALAGRVLKGMLQKLGKWHQFIPDDQDSLQWPSWCKAAPRTTDAHLEALAKRHQALLATLDAGIPGAFLLP
jgi:predicted nucleic acid-binding protein